MSSLFKRVGLAVFLIGCLAIWAGVPWLALPFLMVGAMLDYGNM